MEDENYQAMLDKLKEQDEKIVALTKRCEDIIKFNSTLLNATQDEESSSNKKSANLKELDKRLKEGLRWHKKD